MPEGVDLREQAASLAPRSPERSAVVRARPDRAVGLRQRATTVTDTGDGWDRLEYTFGRFDATADDLASYGPDVVVDEPLDLRDAVVQRLRSAAGGAT